MNTDNEQKQMNELPEWLQKLWQISPMLARQAETDYIDLKKQLPIHVVRLMLPDEKELNSLKNQYPASGGDAGWIQDAYKSGYIDGWNRKRTDKHLRKSVKKHKHKGN